jgi:hypothetical protein
VSAEIAERLSRKTSNLVTEFELRADAFRGRDDPTRILVPAGVAGARAA